MDERARSLGVVTEGSFSAGLTVRLAPDSPTESLRVGSFVVLEGENNRYFSLITDLRLRMTDAGLAASPPERRSAFLRRVLSGSHTYATAEVRPDLMLENVHDLTDTARPGPVRNIPMHFAEMRLARPEDFDLVFGAESATRFALGSPPAMDIRVPIDLEEFVTRSNGIFGQSGTGKSVLTRLLLFGIMKSRTASVLLFDMHGEYARRPAGAPELAGLVDLLGSSRIREYSLDPAMTSGRDLRIGLNQIEPEDIELLAGELNLTGTFGATTHQLWSRFHQKWLATLLEMSAEEIKEFCAETLTHEGALSALKQKLAVLERKEYLLRNAETRTIDDILIHLQKGEHVILTFGRYQSLIDYMLVANIVTRRIHQRYTDQVLRYEGSGGRDEEPRRLLVVLEEAHKFLAPEAARQSIFGTIAREMRKYAVTLLVVDQRPSGIDPEVLSQLGTRVTGLLTDSQDIDAVLTGAADRSRMRGLLASLRPRQECLILGHAIPMPIVLRTRDYNYDELMAEARDAGVGSVTKDDLAFLYGETDE
ncbi:MAG TPA: ATP-binding protein [Nitrolancea sp.]|nr:ATP-binding protein [Nitrolancea sp.]